MGQTEYRGKEGQAVSFTAPEVRILIVDDNRVSLKVAEGLLRPYHMQVETADSGACAVEMVQDHVYDLILMDYMMPDMNGADAAKMIRSMEGEQYKKLVIVALTGNAEQEVRELLVAAGINDFMAKPVKRSGMDKILSRWIPKDKIVSGQENPGEGRTDTEQEDLSDWRMDGIDVEIGMSYSGNDRALYLEVLTDFADSIEERAAQIEQAMEERELDMYIMGVHALKSSARYLGAVDVADMAQALEADAKREDWRAVELGTPKLLFSYRNLYQSIAPYQIDRTYTGRKKRFNREEVRTLLQQLEKCMDEYDIDGGEEAAGALQGYDLGKAWSGRRDRIMRAVDQFDYEACKKETRSWRLALEKES